MKNIFAFLMALSFILIISCSSDTDNNGNTQNSGNGVYGEQAAENGQIYQYEHEEKYTRGDLTIYMAQERDQNGHLMLTEETMFEVGTISNGEVSLALPKNVDSRFLARIDELPSGIEIKPLGVDAFLYLDKLRLIDNNGKHIGNLVYCKIASDTEYHCVYYGYFLENLKISGTTQNKDEYKIDAKKGWNKIYVCNKHLADQSSESYITTDLSKVPDGLRWIVTEFAN